MTLPFFPDPIYYIWFFGLPLLAFLIILSIIVIRKLAIRKIEARDAARKKSVDEEVAREAVSK